MVTAGGSDFAYLGNGSIEWANWARAILVLRSMGEDGVHELRVAKRGGRLRWKDETGEKCYTRYFAHTKEPDMIFWQDAEPPEKSKQGRPVKHKDDAIIKLLPPGGLATAEWQKKAYDEKNVSRATFYRLLGKLEEGERVTQSCTNGKWQEVVRRVDGRG